MYVRQIPRPEYYPFGSGTYTYVTVGLQELKAEGVGSGDVYMSVSRGEVPSCGVNGGTVKEVVATTSINWIEK